MSFTQKGTTIIKVDIRKLDTNFFFAYFFLFLFAADSLAQETAALSNKCLGSMNLGKDPKSVFEKLPTATLLPVFQMED